MASKKPKRSKRMVSRRGKKGRLSHISNMPPLIPMSRPFVHETTIRVAQALAPPANTGFTFQLNLNSIIDNTPYLPIISSFTEIKIHSIRVWAFVPTATFNNSGFHTLVINDNDSSTIPGQLTQQQRFINVADFPGAVTRRIFQPLHSFWKPTEPTDREWLRTLGTAALPLSNITNLSYAGYWTNLGEQTPTVEFVYDLCISLRGVRMGVISNLSSLNGYAYSPFGGYRVGQASPDTVEKLDDSRSVSVIDDSRSSDVSGITTRMSGLARNSEYVLVKRA